MFYFDIILTGNLVPTSNSQLFDMHACARKHTHLWLAFKLHPCIRILQQFCKYCFYAYICRGCAKEWCLDQRIASRGTRMQTDACRYSLFVLVRACTCSPRIHFVSRKYDVHMHMSNRHISPCTAHACMHAQVNVCKPWGCVHVPCIRGNLKLFCIYTRANWQAAGTYLDSILDPGVTKQSSSCARAMPGQCTLYIYIYIYI